MGKWSPQYFDDVLHFKLKTLVSASIRRAALEKSESEPTISYEAFVEDLDTGDSFTATMIDILVQEMADRRQRTAASEPDKRRISERTARSLQLYNNRDQIYRPRRPRRVSSSPHIEMDNQDFEGFMDASGAMEGVTVNPVHEAYGTDAWADEWASSLVRSSSPDPISLEALSGSDPVSTITLPSSLRRRNLASHAHSLTRQASIRRPTRSRTVDFNDFTSRRRSATRDISIRDTLRESMGLPIDVLPEPLPDVERDSEASSSNTRRFFPLTRRRSTRDDYISIMSDMDSDATPSWLSDAASRQSSADRVPLVERRMLGPRLRRGGLRAPESMLSRHASPVPPSLPSPISIVDTPTAELVEPETVNQNA